MIEAMHRRLYPVHKLSRVGRHVVRYGLEPFHSSMVVQYSVPVVPQKPGLPLLSVFHFVSPLSVSSLVPNVVPTSHLRQTRQLPANVIVRQYTHFESIFCYPCHRCVLVAAVVIEPLDAKCLQPTVQFSLVVK